MNGIVEAWCAHGATTVQNRSEVEAIATKRDLPKEEEYGRRERFYFSVHRPNSRLRSQCVTSDITAGRCLAWADCHFAPKNLHSMDSRNVRRIAGLLDGGWPESHSFSCYPATANDEGLGDAVLDAVDGGFVIGSMYADSRHTTT